MNDQNAKVDAGKLELTLVPPELIEAVAVVRRYGNMKYHDPQNWRRVDPQRYWEAAIRHTIAAWEDYKAIDQESKLPHLFHIATNIAFILSLERMTHGFSGDQRSNQSAETVKSIPTL